MGITPVMAERVLGVMVETWESEVGAAPRPPSQAVVPGEAGGKMEPMIGVRPDPGVRPVRGGEAGAEGGRIEGGHRRLGGALLEDELFQ